MREQIILGFLKSRTTYDSKEGRAFLYLSRPSCHIGRGPYSLVNSKVSAGGGCDFGWMMINGLHLVFLAL